MTLHSVGPATMSEDENKIGSGYQVWLGWALFAAPIIAIRYIDLKVIAAFSIGTGLLLLHEIGGRLYDLCIRLRRTNLLLSEGLAGRTSH